MTERVSRLFDLRPGEGRPAVRLFATLFSIVAGHTMLEAARDAIFLEILPPHQLTLVYLLLAGLGFAVPWYTVAFSRHFGRRDALVSSLVVGAFGTTWLHFLPASPTAAFVLYGWSALLGTVLVVQLWTLAAQLFDVSRGKRLFPLFAAGGVAGAVVGGATAVGLLALLRQVADPRGAGPADPTFARALLLAASAWLVVAALAVTTSTTDDWRRGRAAAKPAPQPPRAGSVVLLLNEPYVARLAGLVAVSSAALLATDYVFKVSVAKWLSPAELGPFFARYYAAVNGVALLVQLFLAARVVRRLGVVAALAVLPLCLLGGAGVLLVAGGGLAVVLLTRGADGALRHSLHRVASELLYLPLPPEVRDRGKALLESVVVRGSQAVAATLLLGLATASLDSVRTLAAVLLLLAAGWAAATLALRRGYLDLFRQRLGRGLVDPKLRLADLDPRAVEVLLGTLASRDEAGILAALDVLAEGQRTDLIPAHILRSEVGPVLERALEIIPAPGRQDWIAHAERLLTHERETVQRAAVRALGRAHVVDALASVGDGHSLAVQAYAAFYLARAERSCEPEDHPAMARLLGRLLPARGAASVAPSPPAAGRASGSRALRLALLDVLREDGDDRWTEVLDRLADSTDDEVGERAALAMARVAHARFLPTLVQRLAHRRGRAAVRDALVALGAPALEELVRAFARPATSAAVRLHIPRTIARFGTQRAADVLTAMLDTEADGAVRFKVLRGLGALAARHAVRVDPAAIATAIELQLREFLRLLSLQVALRPPDASRPAVGDASERLLLGLLADKRAQALERALRLFQILHRDEDVRGIHAALRSADPLRRADAREFLDALAQLGAPRCRELFRLVVDDLADEERLRRAAAVVPARPTGEHDALRQLLAEPDDALAALAAYRVRIRGAADLVAELEAMSPGRPNLELFRPPPASAPQPAVRREEVP